MDSETSSDGVYTEYTFDEENRLTLVEKDGIQTAAYTYDGDGGRTSKTVSGVQTKFIGSMYEEHGASQTEHIFVGSMRIASITDGVISFHHADHLGGLNVITDDTGAIKEVVEYKPFGEFATREKFGGGADVAWHYFTGQHFDAETELYFYNARYYNPKLGRFISADTIVQDPSNPQTLNRYSYTGNNPVNNIDPSGHSFWRSFVAAFVGVVAAVLTAGISVGFTALAAGGWGSLSAGTLALSGAVGGAISGGVGAALNGAGWRGILQGAAIGGALGAVGGFAAGGGFGNASGWISGGMFVAGATNAVANDGLADFAGGLLGGLTGNVAGMGAVNAKYGTLSNSAGAAGSETINEGAKNVIRKVQQGEASSSDVLQSINNSKGNIDAFVSKVEAYVHLNGQEVDSILGAELSRFPNVNRGSSGNPNLGLIAQGVGETAFGVALQVFGVIGVLETGGLASPVGVGAISSGGVMVGVGVADILLGIYGQKSFGSQLNNATSQINNQILKGYMQLRTFPPTL